MAGFIGEHFKNEDTFVGKLCDTDEARIEFERMFADSILTARGGCLERGELAELASSIPARNMDFKKEL